MLFNSIDYLIFLPVVVALYFAFPARWRWLLLLLASYYFYLCWKPVYLLLLMGTTLVSYFAALRMGEGTPRKSRKRLLVLTIVFHLLLLGAFKYLDFFTGSLNLLFREFNLLQPLPLFHILLPVGISFYIFMSLSYILDVYRGIREPERHPGYFALYVSFFPQLVSGPITRSGQLLPQIREPRDFSRQGLVSGLKLMLWGYFKKVVIADRLGMFVGGVFENPADNAGLPVMLATVLFAFQLYCDFSGYTDIARGSARLLGFDLMINFNRPLIAKSLRDFWNRWHISLTTWFRDYLLYSLPYVRKKKVVFGLIYLNLIITYLLMGFWHGAAWTFIIFGAFHGILLVLETITEKQRNWLFQVTRLDKFTPARNFVGWLATFSLLAFSLIFFRANTLSDSLALVRNLTDFSKTGEAVRLMLKNGELLFGLAMVIALMIAERLHEKHDLVRVISRKPLILRWGIYIGFIFFILVFGVLQKQKFIYFQF